MKRFSGLEITIPYEDMLAMRKAGKLNLGMNENIATKVADDKRYAPKSIKTNLAMHFWSWVAVGQFIYAIYESITRIWWIFIPSFFLMFVIHRANKKGTSQNLLDEAMTDRDFYERVREADGWLYELNEDEAEQFKRI